MNDHRKASKRDVYGEVTRRIIGLLEQGVAPWRMTWSSYGLARNYATGHVYTGINMILMNHTPHAVPYFMTFNQVKERGGNVRKGSKAELVVYYRAYFKDEDGRSMNPAQARIAQAMGRDIRTHRCLKYYNVFNIADIEGIAIDISEVVLKENERLEACERLVARMPKRPTFRTLDANQPYYSPRKDVVNMPDIRQFDSPQAYYATLFHELAHSTGHASRLGREAVMCPERFGAHSYSREELLAEMAASYLCATVRIDQEPIVQNSAAYLAGWLKVLKADSRFIFKAAAGAQKAADYILGKFSG